MAVALDRPRSYDLGVAADVDALVSEEFGRLRGEWRGDAAAVSSCTHDHGAALPRASRVVWLQAPCTSTMRGLRCTPPAR
jgi:hypothetical protein